MWLLTVLAHEGGWDEILLPVLLIAVLVVAVRRTRARARKQSQNARRGNVSSGGTDVSTTTSEPPEESS